MPVLVRSSGFYLVAPPDQFDSRGYRLGGWVPHPADATAFADEAHVRAAWPFVRPFGLPEDVIVDQGQELLTWTPIPREEWRGRASLFGLKHRTEV